MHFRKPEPFSREWVKDYLFILRGAVVSSLGYAFFIVPHKIIPGGIFGITVILYYKLGLPVGVMLTLLNIPLLFFGVRILGRKFGARTITGILLTSVFTDLFIYLGHGRALSDDMLVSAVFGAILAGAGLASIFMAKATTGGIDILAQILLKKWKWPIGRVFIFANFVVITAGAVVFRNLDLAVYAVITTFVCGKVIDTILEGFSYFKGVLIISEQYEKIRRSILHELRAGGTSLIGKGLYKDEERRILFTVINRRNVAYLKDYVKDIDPSAFVVVFNTQDVYGYNLKRITD